MIEILILFFACKKMGALMRDKGWERPLFMQIAVVLAWFGGEVLFALGYGVYLAIKTGDANVTPGTAGTYAVALLGAVLGMALTFLVAKLLPYRMPEADEAPEPDSEPAAEPKQ